MRLHEGYLGSRFGLDDDDSISIVHYIYPGHITADNVDKVISQMDYVWEVLLPFVQRVLQNGEIPSDGEIDRTFSV